jgi:hypothetical protein
MGLRNSKPVNTETITCTTTMVPTDSVKLRELPLLNPSPTAQALFKTLYKGADICDTASAIKMVRHICMYDSVSNDEIADYNIPMFV